MVSLLANIIIINYAIKRIKKQEPFKLLDELKNIPLAFLPLAIMGTLALAFLVDPIEQIIPISEIYQEYFTELLSLKVYSFIVVVLVGPILEEILFRGIILKSFLKNDSALKAILLSSLFFAIIHLNLIQFTTAFIGGAFFGYLYWQTKSLSICIIAHIIHNVIFFLAFHFLNADFNIESAISNTAIYLTLYFIAAITLASCILIIYKKNISTSYSC